MKKYIVEFKASWFLPFDDDYFRKTFESNKYKIIKEISKYIIQYNYEHVFQKIYGFEIIEGEL